MIFGSGAFVVAVTAVEVVTIAMSYCCSSRVCRGDGLLFLVLEEA